MRRFRSLLRDQSGATLVESALVVPLMLILTFGLVEFGHVFWQYHAAEKATAAGARWLATRHGVLGSGSANGELWTAPVPDCFVNSTDPSVAAPGTLCTQYATSTWIETCSGAGGGACDDTVWTGLVTEMQRFAPFITDTNVSVELRGSNIGFVGRGRAVPLITAKTTGLTYNFIALGALVPGVGSITMPSFASTEVAEDQKEGPGI
ncbi:pilus assembly protein [Phenylobacterium sp. LjRoot219]|uniref:TadE/TadG family type IV pilus assembly protein n=1 Tax=Phenylobacterium sp. LjRoot219 TaxID=3342283 RepID=UPI003ECF0753